MEALGGTGGHGHHAADLEKLDNTLVEYTLEAPLTALLVFVACSSVLDAAGVAARTEGASTVYPPGSPGFLVAGPVRSPYAMGIAFACDEKFFADPTSETDTDLPLDQTDQPLGIRRGDKRCHVGLLQTALPVTQIASTMCWVRLTLEVSAGELIDRITILELKLRRLPSACRPALRRELTLARGTRDRAIAASRPVRELTQALCDVNRELWDLEEELRECESGGRFGKHFVALARRVYLVNDRRAALKRRLDQVLRSSVREHKSHTLPDV